MSAKNYNSSDLTNKIRNQTIYANYIIQRQKMNQGCSPFISIEGGSGSQKESSIWIDIQQATAQTTLAEQTAILANNNCPVAPIPNNTPITYNDVLSFARALNTSYGGTTTVPTSGGALTLSDISIGNYEYTSRSGNTTISSFTNTDWFTNVEDTVSSWIIVNGNLTINAGQTVIPTKRKLFTVVYVNGNLAVNGSISMTARGANHSGTGNSGGFTAPVNIPLAIGTFSAVTNPQIPATGGTGGARISVNGKNDGTAGSSGGTGGGGSGQRFLTGTSGAGSDGTCFTGGGGGGGGFGTSAAVISGDALANGGRGGDANVVGNQVSGGGAGNPGGSGTGGANGPDGNAGTGGVLIIICEGSLSGSGTIEANGVDGAGAGGQVFGGASGGGSITVFYKTNTGGAVTVTASGGSAGQGGSGGAGTARKLALP